MATFTDMKELADLPVGGVVTLEGNDDQPWTKVDDGWMDNGSVRIRMEHFSGAITAGKVETFDAGRVRRWTVRRGPVHYSVALSPDTNDPDRWVCLTYSTADPTQPYHAPFGVLTREGMGDDLIPPDQVPWNQFARAMAVQIETMQAGHTREVESLQSDLRDRTAQVAQMSDQIRVVRNLRAAFAEFQADPS